MRVLIVESVRSEATFLGEVLQSDSYAVDIAETAVEAIQMAEAVEYDLAVVALELPRIVGTEVLKHIRAREGDLPVLVLTHRKSIEDRVTFFDLGADDYMTKPFAVRELLARVRALLRRVGHPEGLSLKVADLELDRVAHTARRAARKIRLTAREFALLEYLMRNVGRSLSRSMIIEHIWDRSFDTYTNVVDVYINYLRKKVDQGFDRRLIRTVRGVGYQLSDRE